MFINDKHFKEIYGELILNCGGKSGSKCGDKIKINLPIYKSNKDFTSHDWNDNHVLLFGSEGYGLKHQTLKNSDFIMKININNKIESLNISNSASVVFHHINFLRKKK